MPISDKDQATLRYLTYAVQFDRPMKKGIERVFHMLIDPSIPFRSTAEFLKEIESLLKISHSLAGEVTTTYGHEGKEIREFLELLAKEIEMRYPNILRSGTPASRSGTWFRVDQPEYRGRFSAGEILPGTDDITVIWQYEWPKVTMRADAAIKLELVTYYKKSIIGAWPEYTCGEHYANASASRLRDCLTESEMENASFLLKRLSIDLESQFIRELQALTEVKWLEDEVYKLWLQDVFDKICLNFYQKSS